METASGRPLGLVKCEPSYNISGLLTGVYRPGPQVGYNKPPRRREHFTKDLRLKEPRGDAPGCVFIGSIEGKS